MHAAGTVTQNVTQQEYLTKLRQNIATYFNKGELRTLCFDLGIRYDDLPGEGKASKARELVDYLDRHNRIPELVAICRQTRPDVPWKDTSAATRQAPSMAQDHLAEVTATILLAYLAYLHRLESQASRRLVTLITVWAFLVLVLVITVAVALVVR